MCCRDVHDKVLDTETGANIHEVDEEETWFDRMIGRLTNLQILIITSSLFTLLVVAEIVGALVSGIIACCFRVLFPLMNYFYMLRLAIHCRCLVTLQL